MKLSAFEVQDALETFQIIYDTREHQTELARNRLNSFGVPVKRMTLSYGDYCADVAVDTKESLFAGTASAIKPKCVVERKQSLDELAMCFTRGRDRFRREFERAAENNAKIYLLVENASWEGIFRHGYRSKFRPEAFMASLTAWMVRYDITPVFCKAGASGMIIKEILFRDMKERLERGEYG